MNLRSGASSFFYEPFEDYVKMGEPLWYIGFIEYYITYINDEHIHITYNNGNKSKWDNFSVIVLRRNKKYD